MNKLKQANMNDHKIINNQTLIKKSNNNQT